MEWAQVLSIVLPIIFAIVVGIFYQNKRFEDMHKRFDDVNKRFDDVNKRFDDVNKRFDDVNKRIDDLREEVRDLRNMIMLLIQKETFYQGYFFRGEERGSVKEEKVP